MQKIVGVARKTILYISALVLVAGYPATAMAAPQELTTTTEPETSADGQASDAQDKKPAYTYDPATKKWNSDKWQWNAETGKYEKPPKPVVIEPATSVLGQPDQSGSGSETATKNMEQQSVEKNVDTDVAINNDIASEATSGDALIADNTKAGSALTGDATAVANIINSVNSNITTGENQKIATFTKDIFGDVKGDIVLYPLLLKAMLEQEAQKSGAADIDATTNLNVNNDVTLTAKSGDATVKNNTEAGDATTGSATAMANVVNILNSLIATQDSFVGTINIYGSLEGDILIAPDFIPQMLASNGGSDSSTKLSTKDTTSIVNNISAVAESGAASVFGNTNGGSAKTGDAESNVVIFNVTGRDIIAENSMLVFVNVLGKWVGMIVDAPGATAAMIGNGVTNDKAYSPDLTIESESKHGITNTIAVTAGSGDATVKNNTTAGNATSGDAHAFVNVANVSNSSLSLAGWFGLLFINITGDWLGSFQVDTEYGNLPKKTGTTATAPPRPVEFVPEGETPIHRLTSNITSVIIDSRDLAPTNRTVLAASTDAPAELPQEASADAEVMSATTDEGGSDEEEANNLFLIVTGSIILLGSSIIGARRILS